MPPTPSNLILEPAELNGLRRMVELHQYMTTTHPTAQSFQVFMRRATRVAKDSGMSTERRSDQIDAAQWQAYVDGVCRSQAGASLRLYDRCWPLRFLQDFRVEKNLNLRLHVYPKGGNVLNASNTPSVPRSLRSCAHRTASACIPATRSLRSSTRTVSDIKPPVPAPQERATNTRYVPLPKPYAILTQRKPRSIVVPAVPFPLPPRPSLTHAKPTSLGERLPHRRGTASQAALPASSCSSDASVYTAAVHVGCMDCGSGPRFIGRNSDLCSVVGEERQEDLRVLSDGGLVDDAHLKIFRTWPPGFQALFIMDLPATPFIRQVLLQKLGHTAPLPLARAPGGEALGLAPTMERRTGNARGVRHPQPTRSFSGILQPSRELEQDLTDPNQGTELLRAAMELDAHPELFDDILQFFRRDGFPYLMSFQPSEEEVEKAVKDISRERLLFERYENYWPIRFLIKRIVRKRASNSNDGVGFKNHWVWPSIETASQKSTNTVAPNPPRIVYNCPLHAGPDLSRVSSKIRLFLSHRGLSEFVPIFSYIGIRTDTDFIRFCAFSGKEKEALLENARRQLGRRLILNVFQKVALKLEFTADK